MEPFDLTQMFVHLGLGAKAEALPDFSWDADSLRRYEEAHRADADEGRLVVMSDLTETWTQWERHPAGDEVVIVLSGRVTLVQELDGGALAAEVHAGEAVINPAGVWHTCDVLEPGRALYITPGRGTEHRPRDPRGAS